MKSLFLLSLLTVFACRQSSPTQTVLPANGAVEKPVATLPAPIPQEANSNPKSFIPAGYELLDSASGDLNGDAFTDFLLVLKKPNEEELKNDEGAVLDRPLLILTGAAGGVLHLAARNNKVVYQVNDGGMMGDPYTGLTIKNGYFSVEYYGGSAWRWSHITTFKWNAAENTWLLFKEGGDSFHALEPEKVKTQVRTQKDFGKVLFENFDSDKTY